MTRFYFQGVLSLQRFHDLPWFKNTSSESGPESGRKGPTISTTSRPFVKTFQKLIPSVVKLTVPNLIELTILLTKSRVKWILPIIATFFRSWCQDLRWEKIDPPNSITISYKFTRNPISPPAVRPLLMFFTSVLLVCVPRHRQSGLADAETESRTSQTRFWSGICKTEVAWPWTTATWV